MKSVLIYRHIKKSKAFTLVELTVSMGILALIVGLTVGVLVSVVKSYQKQRVIAEIERNGDFVMRTIEESLRGAHGISCVDYDGLPVPLTAGENLCDLGNTGGRLLYISYGVEGRYFGRGNGTSASCQSGANCFIYSLADRTTITSGTLPASPDPKLTNDSAVNGVHVSKLEAVIRGDPAYGQPYNITVTMDVMGPTGSAWASETRTFQSFLTLRGTYN